MHNKNTIYDVVIVGTGITGVIIAYNLSKYDFKILILEKNYEIADETTNANSGVIHGGYDAEPGTLQAKLNVLGNKLWQEEYFNKIEFPYQKINSLVIAYNNNDMKKIQTLYDQGIANGLHKKWLKIIDQDELQKREPCVNPKAIGALLCTNSFRIEARIAANSILKAAVENNVFVLKNAKVTRIKKTKKLFNIQINDGAVYKSKIVINAAGNHSDYIQQCAGFNDFIIKSRRGEYIVLSRTEKDKIKNICFLPPTKTGKGVLVLPLNNGRVLVGPTAQNNVKKSFIGNLDDKNVKKIKKVGKLIIPTLNVDLIEKRWAGSRPIEPKSKDFYIKSSTNDPYFINVAGISSPGLSSSPAIALEVIKIIKTLDIEMLKRKNYCSKVTSIW